MPKSVDRGSPSHHGADGTDADLGEVLAGDRRRASLYDLRFDVDITWTALCHFRLSQDDIKTFIDAIRQHYIFEMFVDDLGVKGFIGEIEETQTKFDSHIHNETHIYLFTHLDFSIAYNGNNVIAVNLTTDPQQRLELEFGKDVRARSEQHTRSAPLRIRLSTSLSFSPFSNACNLWVHTDSCARPAASHGARVRLIRPSKARQRFRSPHFILPLCCRCTRARVAHRVRSCSLTAVCVRFADHC